MLLDDERRVYTSPTDPEQVQGVVCDEMSAVVNPSFLSKTNPRRRMGIESIDSTDQTTFRLTHVETASAPDLLKESIWYRLDPKGSHVPDKVCVSISFNRRENKFSIMFSNDVEWRATKKFKLDSDFRAPKIFILPPNVPHYLEEGDVVEVQTDRRSTVELTLSSWRFLQKVLQDRVVKASA